MQEQQRIYADPVLQEVWRIKDELSASYGHDVNRLFEITKAHEEESRLAGRRIVDLSQVMSTPKQS
jgi:hypothetical protein